MTQDALPYGDIPDSRRRTLGIWVAIWSAMVVVVVIIGGITRLTESGLSITEWAPVSGVLPPLSNEAWQEAFLAYQQIPEYQEINRGMTLSQFKSIYFWEYVHRLWARIIGLALAVPLLIFWFKGWLTKPLTVRLLTLLALTGAQGALGWIMVTSGLTERTDVSQYRLAAHLGLALIVYLIGVWTTADLLWRSKNTDRPSNSTFRSMAGALTVLIFAAALAGAFVAGIDGGRAYNSFPLMGGRLVPAGYFTLDPWWKNVFENVAAVQFNHRWIGVAAFAAVIALWTKGRTLGLNGYTQRWLNLLPLVATAQVVLGISTLILAVPISVAVLHQLGAVLLLTVSALTYHGLTRSTPRQSAVHP